MSRILCEFQLVTCFLIKNIDKNLFEAVTIYYKANKTSETAVY